MAGATGVPAPPSRPARTPVELRQALAAARHGHLDRAFYLASRVTSQAPDNRDWVTIREILRQRAVMAHLQAGRKLATEGHHDSAADEFRAALALDPASEAARQSLAQQFPSVPPPVPSDTRMRVERAAPPIQLDVTPGRHAFHLRMSAPQAAAEVAAAYGLRVYVADNVPRTAVSLDVDDATFTQAMTALRDVSALDYVPLDSHTLYFGTQQQLKGRQPLATRTFYLPWVADTITLNQITTTIRTLLGVPQATAESGTNAISVRGTPEQLDATEALLLHLRGAPGEVMLEVRILDLSSTTARDLGLTLPNQFTMFSLAPLLAQLKNSGTLSQDILTLFEQGGLNAVLNSGMLSPSALANAQSLLSPLLQNPFVVFGGGATLMAVSVPNFAANLTQTQGRVSTIETALLRAQSGQDADLKIGQRYPVINASFSPITLSPEISKVLGNGSFIQPFPSFTFEDLGLDAKLTPHVSLDGEVRLKLDLTISSLTGAFSNNIPITSQRHLITEVGLRDGEPVVVAGLLNKQEMRSLSGLPGLSQIPGLGRLFSAENLQTEHDQLVLLITPHLVQLPARRSAGIWLPASFAPIAPSGN